MAKLRQLTPEQSQRAVQAAADEVAMAADHIVAMHSDAEAADAAYAALRAAETCLYDNNHADTGSDAVDASLLANSNAGHRLELFSPISFDIRFAERHGDVPMGSALIDQPLWPEGVPEEAEKAWASFKQGLLQDHPSWSVWIAWYENRVLDSRSAVDPALEHLFIGLTEEFWEQDAPTVNHALNLQAARISEAIQRDIDPIPLQAAGPRVALGPQGRIHLVPPVELDQVGNHEARIRQLLPLVRETADDLAARLNPNDNAFSELVRDLNRYRASISGLQADISWGVVWGYGVRLEETASAVERRISDRLAPALEDGAQAALQSLCALHGPLILATAEGLELQEQADRLRMTRTEQAAFREDARVVAVALQQQSDIVEPEAAEVLDAATEAIGVGGHAERGTTFGIASIKNISILLISGAVVAVPPAAGYALDGRSGGIVGGLLGAGVARATWEALKQAPMVQAASKALGNNYHTLLQRGGADAEAAVRRVAPFRSFVRVNEQPLRRIAASTRQLNWMASYIDYIVRTDSVANAQPQPRDDNSG